MRSALAAITFDENVEVAVIVAQQEGTFACDVIVARTTTPNTNLDPDYKYDEVERMEARELTLVPAWLYDLGVPSNITHESLGLAAALIYTMQRSLRQSAGSERKEAGQD